MNQNPGIPEGLQESAWLKLARPEGKRWAIAERDLLGEVIGEAYRDARGDKTFAPGGRRGLIIAWPLDAYAGTSATEPVFVCEGATDTAALLGLGFQAVGVPMAGHCGEMLAELLTDRHVVFVADADQAGRQGASKLAAVIASRCSSVRIIEPPAGAKDARAAVIAGANEDSFRSLAAAAKPIAASVPQSQPEGSPVTRKLSEVKPEPVSWLWPGRLALGKLTLLAGDPGLGKSFMTLDIAARVSTCAAWPDAPDVPTLPGGVVLLNAEDGVADTIVPRLIAAGADLERIECLDGVTTRGARGEPSIRSFDLSRDVAALEAALTRITDCRLVVIDPISAYLGDVDSHKNADVRALLTPLQALAQRFAVAVVAVTHLNKSSGNSAVHRASGSLAFIAAARAGWLVSKDKSEPRRRLLLPIKNNIGPDTGGLAYRLELSGVHDNPTVVWEQGPVNLTADEALSGDGSSGGQTGGRTECDDAAEWLTEFLSSGPRKRIEIEAEARAAGFSLATLRRAKAARRVTSRKSSFGGSWEWALPTSPQGAQVAKVSSQDAHIPTDEPLGTNHVENPEKSPKVRNQPDVSTLGEDDHLGRKPVSDPEVNPVRQAEV